MKIYNFIIAIIAIVMASFVTGCVKTSQNFEDYFMDEEVETISDDLEQEEDSTSNNNSSMNQNASSNSDMIIYVHIGGAVNNPGVVKLNAGGRLFEAVEKAGGFTDNASKDYCNLALVVSDGEQYYIPTDDEVMSMAEKQDVSSKEDVTSHYDEDGRLNINLASKDELIKLPGIGATRADAILSYREENGSFAKIEDVKKINGIKDALFSQIKEYIIVR